MQAFRSFALLSALSAPVVGQNETLDWANVHAVVVGVLDWQDSDWSSFSDENRQDQLLAETMLARGVPKQQLHLLLDKAATRDAIEDALRAASKAADEHATLIFYYAGHGQRRGEVCAFANYDMHGVETGLGMDRVGAILEEHFQGKRLLTFADCCHSGSLAEVVDRLHAKGVDGASVTSVVAEDVSTGDWTFTQTLIEVLAGDPTHDDDGDGFVELSELRDGVHEAMAYRALQRSGYHLAGAAPSLRLAPVAKPRPRFEGTFGIGAHVRLNQMPSRVGRILDHNDEGQFLVRTYTYARHQDTWMTINEVRPLIVVARQVGAHVTVRQGSDLLPARVIEVDAPFYKVSFPDWPELEDKWMLGHQFPSGYAEPTLGRPCHVEWQGTWYPALILEEKDEQYLIHYVGYGDNWDEWISAERLRLPSTKDD
ncbi:MAG: caspase family protein [Planctomycetota bacterium]|nr:caspase family protein [Planctomycetota bacterium]